jgi:hypothetical protein
MPLPLCCICRTPFAARHGVTMCPPHQEGYDAATADAVAWLRDYAGTRKDCALERRCAWAKQKAEVK